MTEKNHQATCQMSKKTGRKVFLRLFSFSKNLIMSSCPCLAAKSKGALRFLSLGSRSTVLYFHSLMIRMNCIKSADLDFLRF